MSSWLIGSLLLTLAGGMVGFWFGVRRGIHFTCRSFKEDLLAIGRPEVVEEILDHFYGKGNGPSGPRRKS